MNVAQNATELEQARDRTKPSRLFYLCAAGVTLLLAYLSVGLTPSTWWLVWQCISQFAALKVQYGIRAGAVLALLLAQSLLLLLAWVVLIRVVVRAHTGMHRAVVGSVQVAGSDDPRAMLPSLPMQTAQTVQEVQAVLPTVQVEVSMPLPDVAQHVYTAATLFEPLELPVFSNLQEELPFPRRADEGTVLADHAEQDESLFSAARMQSSHEFAWQHDEGTNDPFALHEDILSTYLQDDVQQEGQGQVDEQPQIPTAPQKPVVDEESSAFVFGNPFEGALPDIFEYDEDLKRLIDEKKKFTERSK